MKWENKMKKILHEHDALVMFIIWLKEKKEEKKRNDCYIIYSYIM